MRKHVPSLMCRLCGKFEETIVHLMAACPLLEYLYQHNLIAGVIHWHLMKVYGLVVNPGSWLKHKPPPIVEILVCTVPAIILAITLILFYLTIQKRNFILFNYHALQKLICHLRNMRSYTSINRWHVIFV